MTQLWNYLKSYFVTEVKVPELPIGIPVGNTALWIAAVRAAEAENPKPRFVDPYARLLAGKEGAEIFEVAIASGWFFVPKEASKKAQVDLFTMRSLHFDNFALAATKQGIQQVVIVASGCDTRAWRLEWPESVAVYGNLVPHFFLKDISP